MPTGQFKNTSTLPDSENEPVRLLCHALRRNQLFTWIKVWSCLLVHILSPPIHPLQRCHGPWSGSWRWPLPSLSGDFSPYVVFPACPGPCCGCRGPCLSKHHCSSYSSKDKTARIFGIGVSFAGLQGDPVTTRLPRLKSRLAGVVWIWGFKTRSPVCLRNSHHTPVGSSSMWVTVSVFSPCSKAYWKWTVHPLITWYAEYGCSLSFPELTSDKHLADNAWIQQHWMKYKCGIIPLKNSKVTI